MDREDKKVRNNTAEENAMGTKLKVLWHGVPSEFGTGYGTQTNLFTSWLKRQGHEVVISSIIPDHLRTDINGIQVLPPGRRGNMGNDLILGHYHSVKPDVVISCMDTHIMEYRKFEKIPWVAWQVIDSSPVPPEVLKLCPYAKGRLAMSRFGQEELLKKGYDSFYVPLAYSKDDFYPSNSKSDDRALMSKAIGQEIKLDDFLIVMNSANICSPSRKNFYAALSGFEQFRKMLSRIKNRRAILYVHAEALGDMAQGEDLTVIAESLGIPVENVKFPIQYDYNIGGYGPSFLRSAYSAADVFLNTSRGEGFCLPVVEAMACGTLCIMPMHSSLKEFMKGSDRDLPYQLTKGLPFCSSPGTVQWILDPGEIAGKLWLSFEHFINMDEKEKEEKFRLPRANSMVNQFEIDVVGPKLIKTVQKVLDDLKGDKADLSGLPELQGLQESEDIEEVISIDKHGIHRKPVMEGGGDASLK